MGEFYEGKAEDSEYEKLEKAAEEIASGHVGKAIVPLTGLLMSLTAGPFAGALAGGVAAGLAEKFANSATKRFVDAGRKYEDERRRAQQIANYLRVEIRKWGDDFVLQQQENLKQAVREELDKKFGMGVPEARLDVIARNVPGENIVVCGDAQATQQFRVDLSFVITSSVDDILYRVGLNYYRGASAKSYLPARGGSLHIADTHLSLGSAGLLSTAYELEAGKPCAVGYTQKFWAHTETRQLLGQGEMPESWGIEYTDYGRGMLQFWLAKSETKCEFFLNPGGEMIFDRSQWGGFTAS